MIASGCPPGTLAIVKAVEAPIAGSGGRGWNTGIDTLIIAWIIAILCHRCRCCRLWGNQSSGIALSIEHFIEGLKELKASVGLSSHRNDCNQCAQDDTGQQGSDCYMYHHTPSTRRADRSSAFLACRPNHHRAPQICSYPLLRR